MNNPDHIKPCPFCGGSAFLRKENLYSNNPRNIHACWVECSKCGVEGKHEVDRGGNHHEKAIKFWNTRTEPVNTTNVSVYCKSCIDPTIEAVSIAHAPLNDGTTMEWPVCYAHEMPAVIAGWKPERISKGS